MMLVEEGPLGPLKPRRRFSVHGLDEARTPTMKPPGLDLVVALDSTHSAVSTGEIESGGFDLRRPSRCWLFSRFSR